LLSATEASVLVDHTLDFLSRVWFQHQGLALYRCHPQKGLLECQMARGGDFAMHIPWWNEASCLPASCLEQRRRQSPEGRDSWEPWLAIWVEGRIWGYFVIQGGIWLGEDSDVHMILSWFELALTRLVARAREKNWAHRDALTGLWNRRYMAEYFPTELKKAFRYHYPVSCLLLDIDHFKRLNDEHGHEAGDHALQALGDYLRRTLRESDVAVRLGGEEILVILPHAGIQQAYGVAEKLREGLSGYIQRPSGESLTVSIGIASTQMGLKTEKEIVSRADAALYMAKRGGRNQTIIGQAPSVWPANDSDTHEDPTQGVTLNS
jgi:diguanylate cyclase (GGDEF)-like protein